MDQIWRLKHFLAVAEVGSVQGAARLLSISQPALTKSIRLLETHLGVTLFDRSTRGVALTDAGKTFFSRARTIEIEWDASLADLNASRQGAQGKLRIGAGPTFAAIFLPKVLAEVSELYPNVEVSVRTGVGTEMLPALKSGEISVYVGGLDEVGYGISEGMEEIPLYTQSNVLVAAENHPLFQIENPSTADLIKWRWVRLSYDEQGTRAINRFFRSTGEDPPRFSVSTGSLNIALDLVLEQNFITSLPAPFLHPKLGTGLRALPFPNYHWTIQTGLTLRQSIQTTAPFRAFVTRIQKQVSSLGMDSGQL
ncbi:MAG: LysR family transcriptional regulator [Marinosulfonomonas sp.]|nr:LysR family transcriptional regulator [Marinosulfonomonas sp.]